MFYINIPDIYFIDIFIDNRWVLTDSVIVLYNGGTMICTVMILVFLYLMFSGEER
jgi:hypothetical protein